MTVREFADEFDLEVVAGPALDKEIGGVYFGDRSYSLLANLVGLPRENSRRF
ncbi:hypothetical protein DER71_14414 [Halanaerobium sp. DL-01]|uniref:hypothetical protein n=1 Tax=Halanaerobium sp. DL-01 TaxID=1653064 RepID=UPI000E1463DA|nr:hypothetical protein [Halanaerobium sp. DL-01]RCW79025.1 hypothetical protein DER71_14414 [Halanaerobium sp. DL-01]